MSAQSPRRSRRTALLAGALALAAGAAVTVGSSWFTQARADVEFGTGELTVEVRAGEGQAWREAERGARANRLNYAVTVTGLRPGTTVHAPLSLRTAARSSAGTVSLEPGVNRGSGTLFRLLEYGVVRLPDADDECRPGADGTVLVPAGSPLDSANPGHVELGPDGTDTAHLCFTVTLPEEVDGVTDIESLPELQTTIQWQLTATPPHGTP